jgi:hypothetical protein
VSVVLYGQVVVGLEQDEEEIHCNADKDDNGVGRGDGAFKRVVTFQGEVLDHGEEHKSKTTSHDG